MTMFMGEFNHTVDSKGRLIIPAKFREGLGEEFIVSKGLDGCLFIYTLEEWERFVGKLRELPSAKKEVRDLTRHFMAGAENVTIDKQGRALISDVLRGFAHIVKDVVIVGLGSRLEIWSRENWDSVTGNIDADVIAEQMAELGMSI